MSDRPELVQKAFEARDTGFDYGPYAKALLSYIEALEAAALARAEANAEGREVMGEQEILRLKWERDEAVRIGLFHARCRKATEARVTDALRALKAIRIRCQEGDKRADWLPIIDRLAGDAEAALAQARHPIEMLKDEAGASRYAEVLETAKALREAQRAYLADRGNDVLGQVVAEAAEALDGALARAEANAGEPVIGDERIYPNEPFGSALTAGKPNREELESAAKVALMYLDSGFLACDVCGHQMPTKDTDAAHTLRDALTAGKPEQAVPSEPDWWWRDFDPEDSGDSPHEALRNVPDFCVCLLRSSYNGPDKFAFRSPTLNPDDDDDEVILFDTEHEALAAAKERAEAMKDAAPTAGGGDAE